MKLKSIAELLAAADLAQLPPAIDLQGWNHDHPIFDRLVLETQPRVIIEVGSWKGCSAMHLAVASSTVTELDQVSGVAVLSPSKLYCVDTWLGGIDHLLSDKPQDDLLRDAHGSPQLYHQFLRNFVDVPEFTPRIYPVQNTSINGARLLAQQRTIAELIYIDGSHEYQDVYADLCAYVQILAPGGVMFGDDFRTFPGVFAAVLRFAHEYAFKVEEVDRNFWILRRS